MSDPGRTSIIRWSHHLLAIGLLLTPGCGAFTSVDTDPGLDAGSAQDAGSDAGSDAGPDAGPDGGPDAGPPDGGGLLPLGSLCEGDRECATGDCRSTGWGYPPPTCTAPCDAADQGCPEYGACAIPGAFSGACVPSCGVDEDCIEGFACEFVGGGGEQALGCVATAHDCDPKRVTCRALPPTCDSGQVPAIDGTCWGPCVPYGECLPIPCDPDLPSDGQCPATLVCYRNTRTCGPPL